MAIWLPILLLLASFHMTGENQTLAREPGCLDIRSSAFPPLPVFLHCLVFLSLLEQVSLGGWMRGSYYWDSPGGRGRIFRKNRRDAKALLGGGSHRCCLWPWPGGVGGGPGRRGRGEQRILPGVAPGAGIPQPGFRSGPLAGDSAQDPGHSLPPRLPGAPATCLARSLLCGGEGLVPLGGRSPGAGGTRGELKPPAHRRAAAASAERLVAPSPAAEPLRARAAPL